MKLIITILTALMFVGFSFSSCQKVENSSAKKEDRTPEEFYGKIIPLSVDRIDGNYRKTTSPDGRITISESIDIETNNSLGGITSFEKHYLTIGESPVARYMKVYKDSLKRKIILQEGQASQGDTLAQKALSFRPAVTYYSFYCSDETCFGKYGIADIVVRTVWVNLDREKISKLSVRKEELTKDIPEMLYQEHISSLMKLWRWYITKRYQKDAEGLTEESIVKYALSDEAKKKIRSKISEIESLNSEIEKLRNSTIQEEFISLLSRAVKLHQNGDVEYLTQKGITTQPLVGVDGLARYREVWNRLKRSQDLQESPLEGIIESLKEIKDSQGKITTVLTGFSKIDSQTGFVEGEPLYIEFRIYPPPYRILTINQIKERIQEIERELKKRGGKNNDNVTYFKTLEYIGKEKEILEEKLKHDSKNSTPLIIYLPEILFYHAGIFVEAYTYEYDPKKAYDH